MRGEIENYSKVDNSSEMDHGKRKKPNKIFYCKQCDAIFSQKENLKCHISTIHKRPIQCSMCTETFEDSSALEEHLLTAHKKSKRFHCGTCNMTFVLRWRLHKDLESHQKGVVTRKCHFFNNKKQCPFEKVGCKFLYEEAEDCKYAGLCSRTMCQYQHD